MEKTFHPAASIRGAVRVPGDKSISHRALILAAMCRGESTLRGLAEGRDVKSTMACLSTLGAGFMESRGEVKIAGHGWDLPNTASLDAGNSGTTMRLLAGAAAGKAGSFNISGDRSLSGRPMARIAEPLRLMGASVSLSGGEYPPLNIEGGNLTGIDYRMPIASAQVKSAILLAALQAQGPTTVLEIVQSRDHTERLLSWLKVDVETDNGAVILTPGDAPFDSAGFELDIPGDFSSAAYWLAAACLAPRSQVSIEGVGLNSSRTGFIDSLGAMGAKLEQVVSAWEPEPVGSLRIATSDLEWTEVGANLIPRIIDELPLLALVATRAEGNTTIREASELRHKESDRISSLATGLRVLGAQVEEHPDGLTIKGPTRLGGGVVDSAGDHRLALTFAVAGLTGTEPVTVKGWECTAISYPEFEKDLRSLAK